MITETTFYSGRSSSQLTTGAMTINPPKRVLYVVICGASPAGGNSLADFVGYALGLGWDVCVIATPSALKFIDADHLADLTGNPVRSEYKRPEEPDVLPPADAFVVAPATFNTINKLTAGISDTLALGLLNEGLGAGLPIIAVPFPNQALARHPAFIASVRTLASWGVNVIHDTEHYPLPRPRQGDSGDTLFPWPVLREQLATL